MRRRSIFFALVVAAACGDDASTLPANASAAIEAYADVADASYADALAAAGSLSAAVDAFVAAPDATTFAAAKQAWRDARAPYLQTEPYRFYGGPIDDADPFLNSWPLDEAYIDYVDGMPTSGLVNDASFAITGDAIDGKNASEGETKISAGYHAVEFLLWGQDLVVGPGGGARPYTDYLTSGGTAENQDRRAAFLAAAADRIVFHLGAVSAAWVEGDPANYRAELTSVDPREALRRIFTGLVIFSGNELGGERLVGIETGDPNDEHSCFSDETHVDFVEDQRGVQNVWLGRYVTRAGAPIDGVGLDEVVAAVDPDLAAEITTAIEQSLALAEAIVPPFETEITGGNTAGHERVVALRTALQHQAELLEQAMVALGLPFAPPV